VFQHDVLRFIQNAVVARAISQVQTDRQLVFGKIPDLLRAAVLPFVIAGLLYLLCFEHVDNLGAYSIPSETGLLIPSDYVN
jgi:hypothetical protein